MARQNAKSATKDIQNLFDPQGYQNVFETWAGTNERLAQVAVEAGTRSTDIFSDAAKEALANVREFSQVRDEPAEYGRVYSDFVQKQTELFMRTAQCFAVVTQKASSETSELASSAGQDLSDKVAANAKGATQKASSAANKAA